MRYAEQAAEDEKEKGFDLTVTHRHPRTGLVTHTTPYIIRFIGSGDGGKARVFERPAGSGNLWDKKGDAIGRWDKTKPEGERFIKGAAHIAWAPPETVDQKVARESVEKDLKIIELEKELAAIKAESNVKTQAKK